MNDAQTALGADIVELFGLQDAPPDEQEKFLDAASETILAEVMRKIETQLSQDKREEFYALFEKPATDEERTAFFKQYVPDFKDILMEEIIRFKKEALKRAGKSSEIDSSMGVK